MTARPVRATYRLQLTAAHPLAAAADLVGYLADLGISHLYLSPLLAARPGSTHFYDVADHSRIDQTLGGITALRHLAATAHAADLGLIADVVPTHMAAGPWSPLWDQLLREGRSSDAASFFDVDWDTPLPGAADRVILPVLEGPYGDELAAGALGLAETDRGVRITYRDLSFPLDADSTAAVGRAGVERLAGTPGDVRTWQRMHSLLEQQHYRLVSRRAGRRLVNYRRYHHIDALAALRVEDEAVFDATHGLLIDLVADGLLDGLRVGNPDGLADPAGYLQRLRGRIGADALLVVDALTAPGAPLPPDWPVDGTTGRELAMVAVGMHVDGDGWRQLRSLADALDVLPDDRARWQARAERLDSELGPELRWLVRVVWDASQGEMGVRDVDYRTLLEAVSRILVALPVPRTHVDPATGAASTSDTAHVTAAVDAARAHPSRRRVPEVVWRWLTRLLTGQVRWTPAAAEAVTRFQQLSGPVADLGVGERLLLRHPALVAACEPGGDPDRVPLSTAAVHRAVAAMPARGLRTTTTHDSRYGEDVRMRMAALAGMAADWVPLADRILAATSPPDVGLGLWLLQVVVGAWPTADDGSVPLSSVWAAPDLRARLVAHAVDVARGHGVITSHEEPDAQAEADLTAWLRGVIDPDGGVAGELRPLALRAAEVGMAAGLSQVLLRTTAGGVPDTYQGGERWDDHLSDPDNRRPAALDAIRTDLAAWRQEPPAAAALWGTRRDGRVKQWVLWRALQARTGDPALFGPEATHRPLVPRGRWAANVVAYHRQAADRQAVAVCPRALGRVTDGGRFPPLGRIWADTDLPLPAVTGGDGWTDVLTGATVAAGPVVALADLLVELPVALLIAPAPASSP